MGVTVVLYCLVIKFPEITNYQIGFREISQVKCENEKIKL